METQWKYEKFLKKRWKQMEIAISDRDLEEKRMKKQFPVEKFAQEAQKKNPDKRKNLFKIYF